MDGLEQLLKENGFVISDLNAFDNAIRTGNMTSTIEDLAKMRTDIALQQERVGATDIYGVVAPQLTSIYNIVNGLDSYNRSTGRDEFARNLNELMSVFGEIKTYNDARTYWRNNEKYLLQTRKAIDDLKNGRTNLSDEERTSEYFRLLDLEKNFREWSNEGRSNVARLEGGYSEFVNNFSIEDFRNNFLQNLNKLRLSLRNLGLPQSDVEEIMNILANLEKYVANIGVKDVTLQGKYEETLRKCGLKETTLERSEEVTLDEEKEEIVTPSLDDIVSELMNLNPGLDITIIKDGDRDVLRITAEDISSLVVPEGFSIDGNTLVNDSINFNVNLAINRPIKTPSLEEFIAELESLNPSINASILTGQGEDILRIDSEDIASLVLPEGYELNGNTIINNTNGFKVSVIMLNRPKQKPSITEFYEILKGLNPDVEINLDEANQSITYDNDLVLPEDYELLEGSIINTKNGFKVSAYLKQKRVPFIEEVVALLQETNPSVHFQVAQSLGSKFIYVEADLDTLVLPDGYVIEDGVIKNDTNGFVAPIKESLMKITSMEDLIEEMSRLNPGVEFRFGNDKHANIITNVPVEDLVLPEKKLIDVGIPIKDIFITDPKKEITSVAALIEAIKAVNPSVEFEVEDGILYSTGVDPSLLNLPEGCSYDPEKGIYSTRSEDIAIKVQQKPSKIPKKGKITASKAIHMNPAVKATLVGVGIGALIGLSSFNWLIGAAIGGVASAAIYPLYTQIVKGKEPDFPGYHSNEDLVDGTWQAVLVSYLGSRAFRACKKGMEKLKPYLKKDFTKRKLKNIIKNANIVSESLDDYKEYVARTMEGEIGRRLTDKEWEIAKEMVDKEIGKNEAKAEEPEVIEEAELEEDVPVIDAEWNPIDDVPTSEQEFSMELLDEVINNANTIAGNPEDKKGYYEKGDYVGYIAELMAEQLGRPLTNEEWDIIEKTAHDKMRGSENIPEEPMVEPVDVIEPITLDTPIDTPDNSRETEVKEEKSNWFKNMFKPKQEEVKPVDTSIRPTDTPVLTDPIEFVQDTPAPQVDMSQPVSEQQAYIDEFYRNLDESLNNYEAELNNEGGRGR